MNSETQFEIERYLRTGQTDPNYAAWSGSSFMDVSRTARQDLVDALVAEVESRSRGKSCDQVLPDLELPNFTRRKTEAMVRGLFPKAEQDSVLSLVEGAVVFVTPTNFDSVLRSCQWLGSTWDIANLYLGSIGAQLLGESAPVIVGLNLETTCYVSPSYFEEEDPFSDFVVHEVAHMFHNCRRRRAGLDETDDQEVLLESTTTSVRRLPTLARPMRALSSTLIASPNA